MRAYGVPRDPDLSSPDVADVCQFGLSTKHGVDNRASKRARRRLFKKGERRSAQKAILDELKDIP